ncbi:hypothetical protein XU18_1499 [Perkinsela sp. CCAP 1560/4]|nr:hypothetical protein XU18_1499 [Perkinsela sp. CCAP 1560/4]|eukprot:KNH07913.1 hypothetical protein XU18_1499 [Perkinsela sp. CCAP 1560/4]
MICSIECPYALSLNVFRYVMTSTFCFLYKNTLKCAQQSSLLVQTTASADSTDRRCHSKALWSFLYLGWIESKISLQAQMIPEKYACGKASHAMLMSSSLGSVHSHLELARSAFSFSHAV